MYDANFKLGLKIDYVQVIRVKEISSVTKLDFGWGACGCDRICHGFEFFRVLPSLLCLTHQASSRPSPKATIMYCVPFVYFSLGLGLELPI